MDPDGNASSLDWGATAVNINDYIPVAWRDARIGDPSKMPVHILSGLYVRIYEAQDTSEAFKWHKATDETATQRPDHPPAEAATPRRVVRTIFQSPSKRTPTTSRLAAPLSPAQGSSLLWPSTPSARHSRASSVAQAAAPTPSQEGPRSAQRRRPRPATRRQAPEPPTEAHMDTVIEAVEEGATNAVPEWVALRRFDSVETEVSVATFGDANVEALVDELEDDVEGGVTASASQGAAAVELPPQENNRSETEVREEGIDEDNDVVTTTPRPPPSSSPRPPPTSSLRRLSRTRPTSQLDNHRTRPASVTDDNADHGEDSPPPPASPHRPDIASEGDEPAADSSLPAASSSHIRSSKRERTKRQRESTTEEGPSAKR